MSATQPFRLESGGSIDRDQPLPFTFNGKRYHGYAGDTLASALLANGVRVVGRSFKFHRPRGVLGAGAEECNALVTVGQGGLAEPNVRATLQPLYAGLRARSQNCWPGVNFDLGRTLDYLHFLWPAGFYNKTFIWPNWGWYEGFIRRMSGLGKLPIADDPDHYQHRNAHCDVLIVGAGPAGLSAALAAGERGARVILVEQDTSLGGSLLHHEDTIDAKPASAWLDEATRALRQQENITLLTSTCAVGCFDQQLLVAVEHLHDRRAHPAPGGARQCLWKLHGKQLVLATGAIEQPLLFANNDRPGIMLASAAQQYCKRYAVATGKRIVVATNNDSGYATAASLVDAGIEVAAIVDTRAKPGTKHTRQALAQGLTVFPNAVVQDCRGERGVHSVSVAKRGGTESTASLRCDCVAMAGGWQPTLHLFSQARGKLRYDDARAAFVPDSAPPHLHVAGMAHGAMTLEQALQQGREAGLAATGEGRKARPRRRSKSASPHVERVWNEHRPARQWIDFQHDVTLRDIDIAAAENYTSVEHMKRYTTAGMAVDQGKTGNLNALLALAQRTGRTPAEVGVTTFRPFYLPVTLGALAGRDHNDFYAPLRRSPLDDCQQQAGAGFDEYGGWQRPRVYLRDAETEQQAINREAVAARTNVVVFDGSPLGKFEVQGPDAAEFLNRLYVNNVPSLKTGRARYGLMLNENGVIIDDGIFLRFAGHSYLLHTTSSGAQRIHAWMEMLLYGDWPDLDVLLTPVTTQWANLAVSGPRARELLERLGTGIDLSAGALPHMAGAAGTLDGAPLRVLRAGFTGELSYELNVPADYGPTLWQRLFELGQDLEVMPIGVETLTTLRIEKGYLHVGSDTDGYTTPGDVGWGGAVERKQGDFLGKRSLSRPFNAANGRMELVGLTPMEPAGTLSAGAHVIDAHHSGAPAPTRGYVTSACYSPNLERYVALGLVRDGSKRLDETVNIYHNDQVQPARITPPTAWDPEGERLHA